MSKKRLLIIYVIFIALFAILCLRLFFLANENPSVKVLDGQYSRKLTVCSRRGGILSREYLPLSQKEDGYILLVIPSRAKDLFSAAEKIAKASGKLQSEILEKMYSGAPFVIYGKEEIDEDFAVSFCRYESDGSRFCRHILGYLDTDGVGVTGIEGEYDEMLTMLSGKVEYTYESDAKGMSLDREKGQLRDVGYSQKSGVVTTIDAKLQSSLEEVCDEFFDRGAAVVVDAQNGEIRALCSRPSFDTSDIANILESEKGELTNRAFMTFTPGSVFKIVVAIAALNEDISLFDLEYECTGHIDAGGENFNCHKLSGHGVENMTDAFKNSCNTYFIALAQRIGLSKIVETAKRLGVGKYAYADALRLTAGTLPDTSHEYPALVANTAVGQGDILLSPLEAANLVSAAYTGYICEPSVISGFLIGEKFIETRKKERLRVVKDEVCEKMRIMLSECVKDGTGSAANCDAVNIGGKTATAQSGQKNENGEVIHKWFACAFPHEAPEYIAVFLKDGNGGDFSPAEALCEFVKKIYG